MEKGRKEQKKQSEIIDNFGDMKLGIGKSEKKYLCLFICSVWCTKLMQNKLKWGY